MASVNTALIQQDHFSTAEFARHGFSLRCFGRELLTSSTKGNWNCTSFIIDPE